MLEQLEMTTTFGLYQANDPEFSLYRDILESSDFSDRRYLYRFGIYVMPEKLIIATGNEKSSLRKTDPSQAYTGKHTDITLPYDILAEISAVKADGTRIPIIADGLFAVAGTEQLNEPLKRL